MIKISTSELRRFLGHASKVPDSNRLDIYGFARLTCNKGYASLSKTNLAVSCVVEIEAEFKKDVDLLINLKTLRAIMEGHSEGIKITHDDKNIYLNDGKRELYCQVINDHFPEIEQMPSATSFIDDEMLNALFSAKSHTYSFDSSSSVQPWQAYVYAQRFKNGCYVFGLDNVVSFFRKFKEFPEMILEPEIVSILKSFDGRKGHGFDFAQTENYYHFRCLTATFTFRKSVMVPRKAVETTFEKLKSDYSFEISRSSLIESCMVITKLNEGYSVPPTVSLEEDGEQEVSVKYIGLSGDRGAGEKIPVGSKNFKIDPPIQFLPKNMLTVLKEITAEKIKIERVSGCLVITSSEEEGYKGSVMEIQPINS